MAHPKHAAVRAHYMGRCGYCGVSENETGGELTVDHFRPTSAEGDDSDGNLIYCCFRCNQYKSDFFSTVEDEPAGFRVLHPLLDKLDEHYLENTQTGRLEPLTGTGRFHVELLHLNRPQLVELRLARRLNALLVESYKLLQDENEHLRLQATLLERYLEELRRRL